MVAWKFMEIFSKLFSFFQFSTFLPSFWKKYFFLNFILKTLFSFLNLLNIFNQFFSSYKKLKKYRNRWTSTRKKNSKTENPTHFPTQQTAIILMDSIGFANEANYEEKAEEGRLIVSLPQVTVSPVQSDPNGAPNGPPNALEPLRTRRSFCDNPDLIVARRPSALVSAFRQENRGSSGNIFFEYENNLKIHFFVKQSLFMVSLYISD